MIEQGLPKYDLGSWMLIIGPAGLPPAITTQLNAQINATLALPEIRDWFQAQDFNLHPGTPDAALAFVQQELVKHTAIVKASGATLE